MTQQGYENLSFYNFQGHFQLIQYIEIYLRYLPRLISCLLPFHPRSLFEKMCCQLLYLNY